jgi:hypothetical protein
MRLTTYGTTGYSQRLYTDWDTTTQVGANEAGAGATQQITLQDASFVYFVRMNEFAMAVCAKLGTAYHKGYCGFVRRGYPVSKGGMTKTTAGYAIGVSTMSVASDMTTKMKVGQKVLIYNHGEASASANFTNAEMMTILSIAAGSITFTAVTTKAFDTAAVIGTNCFPGITIYPATAEVLTANNYACFAHDGTRVSNITHTATSDQVILASEANADPDDVTQEYQGGVVVCTMSQASKTGFHGYLYHWEAAASGTQAKEDIMDDGDFVYTVLGVNSTTSVLLMGPQ